MAKASNGLLLSLLLLILSAPASAQTIYKQAPGAYVGVHQVRVDSYRHFAAKLEAGYRFASGVDLGADVALDTRQGNHQLDLGVNAGYTLRLTEHVGLRGDARLFSRFDDTHFRRSPLSPSPFALDGYGADVALSVYRSIPLSDRVTLYPSLGAFAYAEQYVGRSRSVLEESGVETGDLLGGVQASLPVALRVFGDKQLIFEPTLRYGDDPFSNGLHPKLGLKLRFNF